MHQNLSDIVGSRDGFGYTVRQVADRQGRVNRAMEFQANVLQDVEFPVDTLHGKLDFTLAIWIQQTTLSSTISAHNPCFFSFANNVAVRESYMCYNNFNLKDTPKSNSNKLPLNSWVHYAVVRDAAGGVIRIYYNGDLRNTFTGFPTTALNVMRFILGNELHDETGGQELKNQMFGQFSDFRIYDSVKSLADIQVIRDFQYLECPLGQYKNTVPTVHVCATCQYPCQECITLTECITCQHAAFRSDNTTCGCIPNYYDDDSQCQSCQYPCQTCSDIDVCTVSCPGNNTFRLGIPTCKCQDSYYDDPSNKCVSCPKRYSKCKNEGEGIECQGNNRENLSLECVCLSGFHDNEGSDVNCTPCQYPCINCVSLTKCESCVDNINRKSTPDCTCLDNHYEVHQKCKVLICNPNLCATCVGHPDACIEQCPIKCAECDSNSHCTKCHLGYYNKENTCEKCHPKCKMCSDFSTCIQCNPNLDVYRNNDINDYCSCKNGFYESSVPPYQCIQCLSSTCKKCDEHGKCIECLESDFLPPECNKSKNSGYFQIIDPSKTVNSISKCSSHCKTCSVSKDNCDICAKGNHRIQTPPCLCKQGYHDNQGSIINCQKCPQQCKECINDDLCRSCNEEKYRILNQFTYQCECMYGYQQNIHTNLCIKCYYFEGQCVYKCPKGTQKNDNTHKCEQQQVAIQQNSLLIWLCGIIILVSTTVFLLISKLTKNKLLNLSEYQKQKSENQIQ